MRALDLFCGGGGAAQGLAEAGFEVYGIDIDRRHGARYPGRFVHGDALAPPFDLADFDLIWASPPCQAFSAGRNFHRYPHKPRVDLIEPTRHLLAAHPYTVIENVPRAPIRPDLVLTGPMVGLHRIIRRRHFEMSWLVLAPPHVHKLPRHMWTSGQAMTVTTSMSSSSHFYHRKRNGLPGRVPRAEAAEAMGISHHMTTHEIGEAVPPPMARYIAAQHPALR